MLLPFRSIVCIAHVYRVIVYKKQPFSQLKKRAENKSEIITNFTLN